MRLDLATFQVKDVRFGKSTRLRDGVLEIDPGRIASVVLADDRVVGVEPEIVKPGESARILYLRDVVEPRCKVEGPGNIFPGLLGDVELVGSGRTNRLSGVAVMESVQTPQELFDTPELVADQQLRSTGSDSFLDMVGPGALSIFAETINIVLPLKLRKGLSIGDFARAVQLAGLRVASHLAEATRGLEPSVVETLEDDTRNPSLPNVVYIHCVRGAGLHHLAGVGLGYPRGPQYYGIRITDGFLQFVRPTEILDGALAEDGWVCGNRLTTWENLNNPIILDLLRRHGKDVNFCGMILMYIRYTQAREKAIAAKHAAKLAHRLGANGAIITWHRGGNAFVEPMLTVEECAKAGIKAVLVTQELGESEDEPSLLYYSPYAQMIVSTGRRAAQATGAKVERVVGGDTLWFRRETGEPPVPAHGPITVTEDVLGLPTPGLGAYFGFTKHRGYEY